MSRADHGVAEAQYSASRLQAKRFESREQFPYRWLDMVGGDPLAEHEQAKAFLGLENQARSDGNHASASRGNPTVHYFVACLERSNAVQRLEQFEGSLLEIAKCELPELFARPVSLDYHRAT